MPRVEIYIDFLLEKIDYAERVMLTREALEKDDI